ncbi:hypothetical protein [Agrococcus pavilionensis]|nr:hypothetical protein [Agrococcus pavilionensis]
MPVHVVTTASYRRGSWEAVVHVAADLDAGHTVCGALVAESASARQISHNPRCRRCARITAARA